MDGPVERKGLEHLVPLGNQAIEALKQLRPITGLYTLHLRANAAIGEGQTVAGNHPNTPGQHHVRRGLLRWRFFA